MATFFNMGLPVGHGLFITSQPKTAAETRCIWQGVGSSWDLGLQRFQPVPTFPDVPLHCSHTQPGDGSKGGEWLPMMGATHFEHIFHDKSRN